MAARPRQNPSSDSPRSASKRPRKVPWARRIVSTLVLLVLLAGLIFLIVKAFGWVGGLLSAEHEKSTEQAAIKPVSIAECSGEDLKVSLYPATTVLDEGVGFDVAVSIENMGDADCSVQTSDVNVLLTPAGSFGVQGEGGKSSSPSEATAIWSPSACGGEWAKTLLLRPGQSWTGDLKWNGLVYRGCEASADGAAAPEGTYSLTAQAPGQSTPQAVSIQVR